MTVPTLDYQGNAGIADSNAFNLRLGLGWRGEHLYRVYAADESLYFIRVGGSKQNGAVMAAQFGLAGAIVGFFANKRARAAEQQTLNAIAGTDPRGLLASHKYNFVIAVADIATATLLPPTPLSGTAGRCILILKNGKKRRGLVEDIDNMHAALAPLTNALGDKLKVEVTYDQAGRKFKARAA